MTDLSYNMETVFRRVEWMSLSNAGTHYKHILTYTDEFKKGELEKGIYKTLIQNEAKEAEGESRSANLICYVFFDESKTGNYSDIKFSNATIIDPDKELFDAKIIELEKFYNRMSSFWLTLGMYAYDISAGKRKLESVFMLYEDVIKKINDYDEYLQSIIKLNEVE